MNIAIVGTGYVGLVSGACFSEMGIHVTCVDINQEKIHSLENGIIPIYEPGLEDIVKRNMRAGRLRFSTSLASCLDEVEIVFSAVGTPPLEDGSADLSYVLQVARTIGQNMNKYVLVATKSTVPVGTARQVRKVIREELEARKVDISFDVASNPEFLKEGDAVRDFMSPDRVVVGVDTEKARKVMESLYRPFLLKNSRVLFMDIPSAEMTKYAANSMLATRISFMNDIANLCEIVGADVNSVRSGIGADSRIGNKFLYPGCGFGGSCFPKDIKALIRTANEFGYNMRLLKAVDQINDDQKFLLFKKLSTYFHHQLQDKTVAVWGLAFKPQTDDIREAPSLVLIRQLLEAGVRVQVYDPAAMDTCRSLYSLPINYCENMYEAANKADALILVTEWKEFRVPGWDILERIMNHKVIIDGRNIYRKNEVTEHGFDYFCIGQ